MNDDRAIGPRLRQGAWRSVAVILLVGLGSGLGVWSQPGDHAGIVVFFLAIGVAAYRGGLLLGRRRANVALQERLELQSRFEKIATTAPGLLVSFRLRPDGSSCLPYTSPAYQKFFGLNGASMAGDATELLSRTHPDDVGRLAQSIGASEAAMSLWRCEYRVRAGDGEWHWVEGTSVPEREPDGSIIWHGFLTDQTDRKRMEQGLRERLELQSRLEKIAQAAPGLLYSFRVRPDGTATVPYASPACLRFFGLPAEALAADAAVILNRVHPDDAARVAASISESGRTMAPWHCEYRTAAAGGEYRWIDGRSLPEREADGSIYWHGFLSDVTDRRRDEQTLRESADKLRSYVENAPIAVFIADREGTVVEGNRAATELLGYSADEMKHLPLPAVFEGSEMDVVRDDLTTLLKHGRVEREYQMQRRDGSAVWGDVRCVTTIDGRILIFAQNVTGRRLNEKRLSAIVDSAHDAIVMVDADQRITLANPSAERIFGRSQAELLSTTMWALMPAGAVPRYAERLHALDAGEQSVSMILPATQARAVRGNGEEFPIEGSVARSEVGGRIFYTLILRDISERFRMESALRESETKFSKIFQASSVGIVLVRESNEEIVEVNDAYCRISGYERSELIGKRAEQLHPENRDLDAGLRQSITTGTHATSKEYPFHRKDGTTGFGELEAERIEIGGVSYAVAMLTDVTERREAEEALRHSDDRFRQLAESIHEVFWLSQDEKPQIVYVSPAYEKLWGRTCQSLYDSPLTWLEAIHPEDRDRVRTAARTKQALGEYNEEYRIVRPDGSMRWVHAQAFPVRDSSGKVIRVAGVAADITERRSLEAQLRQTQKMESVGQLAGGVAHDFNNWLTVISANAQILGQRVGSDPETQGLVGEIRDATRRATALTRQLLAFSRRDVVEPKLVDLNEVVEDTRKMLGRLLGEDIALTTTLASGLGAVRLDANHAVQVIMNLAVNARDAMPTGGRLTIETQEVTVDHEYARLHPGVKEGRYVRLAVTDTGCGMSAAVLSRIFEPFFTTKGTGKGTGLGLAVVHGIVQQAGGWVEGSSEPNVGTTFRIFLSIAGPIAEKTRAAATEVARGGAETILLVEDEDSVRKVAARLLRTGGYQVLPVSNGRQALEMLSSHPGKVDLLLTDVVMPGMGGRELADQVRARYPQMKVLYTSGYTDDAVMRHGVLQADVAFLSKPYSIDALLEKVRSTIARA